MERVENLVFLTLDAWIAVQSWCGCTVCTRLTRAGERERGAGVGKKVQRERDVEVARRSRPSSV